MIFARMEMFVFQMALDNEYEDEEEDEDDYKVMQQYLDSYSSSYSYSIKLFLEMNHRHFNIRILYQQYGLAMSKF